ncbi:MAG: PfkB family carbohydrate kinase, partial [Tateyamaria sp.]
RGAARVLVTDGGNVATEGSSEGLVSETPPQVLVTRITGAGDTFMAAHIAAETRGADRAAALHAALEAAAIYVSGKTPT